MWMSSLAISHLNIPNLPWLMDLTFQVLMQYCSLQNQTLLPWPVIFTTGHCFCFGSISSFFLVLFLHSSPVKYWAPTNLGSSSFSVLSFCLFILFMGFSGKNMPVVCHCLLQWTMFSQNSPLQMMTAAMKLKDACSLEEVMTNLDSILKSRDITLPTKVCLVKAMVFPVVMYGCESWTRKKA